MAGYNAKDWEDEDKMLNTEYCRICKATANEANLRVERYCEIPEYADHLCVPCYEKEFRGKCTNRPPSDWSYSAEGDRCKEWAIYQDPPCCGGDWGCDTCLELGCLHKNHPTHLDWVRGEAPEKRVCVDCYPLEEKRREHLREKRLEKEAEEQRKWEEERAIQEDADLVEECDEWAYDHVGLEGMAGVRDVCLA